MVKQDCTEDCLENNLATLENSSDSLENKLGWKDCNLDSMANMLETPGNTSLTQEYYFPVNTLVMQENKMETRDYRMDYILDSMENTLDWKANMMET